MKIGKMTRAYLLFDFELLLKKVTFVLEAWQNWKGLSLYITQYQPYEC